MGNVVGKQPRRVHEGRVKAVCFVGWSGSGKTTLVERLVPVLRARGYAVGYLKSHGRQFQMDREGKDTDRIYRAGAERVAIASPTEAALRWRISRERDVSELVQFCFAGCDIVLLEGFKNCDLPKIEVVGAESVGAEPVGAEPVIALVSNQEDARDLPRFERDDIAGLARFVEEALLD